MKYNKGFAPIVLIAIIAGVLVVGGGAYWWITRSNMKEPINPDQEAPCGHNFYEAINKLDISLCEITKSTSNQKNPYYDNYCRESCIQNIAVNKGDAQLCELINPFKNISHVEGWDDPRETGSNKDHCYLQLASKLKDFSLCNKVETEWAKNYCDILSREK